MSTVPAETDKAAEPSLLEEFLIAQAQYALSHAFPKAHRILCRSAAQLQVLGEAAAPRDARELKACREILAAFENRRLRLSMSATGQPLLVAATKIQPKQAAEANA